MNIYESIRKQFDLNSKNGLINTSSEFDHFLKTLVLERLSRVQEISQIDISAIVFPINWSSLENLLVFYFGNRNLNNVQKFDQEILKKIKNFNSLLDRWLKIDLSNKDLETLFEIQNSFSSLLRNQKDSIESSENVIKDISEKILQLIEDIPNGHSIKTSYQHMELCYKGKYTQDRETVQ